MSWRDRDYARLREEELDGEFAGNLQHLPVITPPPHDGPCTHVVVDQSRGRWVCLSSRQT